LNQPHRRARKRRSSRSIFRQRMRRAAAALALLTVLGTSVLWISFHLPSRWYPSSNQSQSEWEQGDLSENLAALAATSVSAPAPLPQRVVYPYSVVPGGIQAPEELREVSEHDRVVGEHYAGFDFRNAHMIELQEPKLVYLSYRIGNRIFWTKHKVSLRKGEKLITDGNITARTRCANQISPVAVEAISPAEPPMEKFEEPVLMAGSAIQVPFPEATLPQGPPPAAPGSPFPGGFFPPLVPPGVPVAVCPPTKKKEGEVGVRLAKTLPCTKPSPPSPVPEPSTILLMASGIAGVYLRYRKSVSQGIARIAAQL
jgi:hypothetical protein